MTAAVKPWQERMPAPRQVMRCTMNCGPCATETRPREEWMRGCEDCEPETIYGDSVAARDAEIADLRAALAAKTEGVAVILPHDFMSHFKYTDDSELTEHGLGSKSGWNQCRQIVLELNSKAEPAMAVGWISVKDRLPSINTDVLTAGGELIEIARLVDAEEDQTDQMGHDAGWIGNSFAFPARSFGAESYKVEDQGQPSHWMPLPEWPDADDVSAPAVQQGGDAGWRELGEQAIKVLQAHIVPDGISDKEALSRMYSIFDGPECNQLLAAHSIMDGKSGEREAVLEEAIESVKSLYDYCVACINKPSANKDALATSAAALKEAMKAIRGIAATKGAEKA